MKATVPVSHQYPKQAKPCSYTLTYNGTNIRDCINSPWIVCDQKRKSLSSKGAYQYNLFSIKPNY